jgi:hypothetical protein
MADWRGCPTLTACAIKALSGPAGTYVVISRGHDFVTCRVVVAALSGAPMIEQFLWLILSCSNMGCPELRTHAGSTDLAQYKQTHTYYPHLPLLDPRQNLITLSTTDNGITYYCT